MARKGRRTPTRRGPTPETVKKQPKQQGKEKIILQRSYLMAQMVTCFLIGFFLLELFVKTGGQSLIYIGSSGLFFISGIFLFIAVCAGRPWKAALWWVGVLSIALFIASVTRIVSAMKETLDLLDPSSPFFHPVIWCGIVAAYLIIIAQVVTSIFGILSAYPRAKKS